VQTCRMRVGSPYSDGGTLGSILQKSWTPLAVALGLSQAHRSDASAGNENFDNLKRDFSASICAHVERVVHDGIHHAHGFASSIYNSC